MLASGWVHRLLVLICVRRELIVTTSLELADLA